MLLHDILKEVVLEKQSRMDCGAIEITGISDNSKLIKKGNLFIAVTGFQADGHHYIKDAISLGAAAVVGEQELDDLGVPYFQVKNSRRVLGLISKNYYKDPSNQKIMVGITGTNGKTTISFMLKHILEKSGISCSIIGTIHYDINGVIQGSNNTTPGAIKLNSLLASSQDQVVIMEVSSHALVQDRLEGIQFDYCIFTNLYHEHLEYHGTMDEYFQAKSLLFEKLKPNGITIVNGDDFWGEKLHGNLSQRNKQAYVVGKSISHDLTIVNFTTKMKPSILLKEYDENVRLELPFPGLHNLYNAALSYPVARMLSIQKEDITLALSHFPGVPGRFEVYKNTEGPTIVIDYAHTADAFVHILQTVKECGAKRIFHIFGFRGGRDHSKRAEMVKVSSKMSDLSILTMDDLNNEKFEDMLLTLNKLRREFSSENGLVIPDRTLAIRFAYQWGLTDDWIIITGKGPEHYQQTFDLPTHTDKETVLYLQSKSKRAII
jgi:UDP-N-acetylmuramoyl-L-alanyl-D-glutamate--2,6-diaminopimelate ligase